MSPATPKWFVRLREYKDSLHATVWLLEKTGLTESCCLFGMLSKERADALCAYLEALGLRVEREQAPYTLPTEEPGLFDPPKED